ncbi:hypothetical protein FGE12_10380 [Aggregicoccus sp. 17bor-14]|uniref:hypothetical protein n=1 Tax=Myxococcaceae TaxID=31 RepID=UPI00129CC4F3|nr:MULTISPECIES: hypothetical protein [Myxococcaceae]MBF5042799.1 hypothetical protein [Simulacricoccus sp. 17bor-14]MRI88567.1 hypothetical protein [Aggregicoccus sp. 17bor-14]
MHPVLARFLDPDAARDTLRKLEAGEPLEGPEPLFAAAAQAHPEQRAVLTGSRTARHLSSDTQAALVLLSAHAAVRALAEDARLGPAVARARAALGTEGASDEETDAFIASILLEEAFGYDDEGADFDADFVLETLGEVPALASLSRERVDGLVDTYAREGSTPEARTLRERMARALVNAAWEDGPAPINPEHVESVVEGELEGQDEQAQGLALAALVGWLQTLAREGLVGPSRLVRLRAQLGDDDA